MQKTASLWIKRTYHCFSRRVMRLLYWTRLLGTSILNRRLLRANCVFLETVSPPRGSCLWAPGSPGYPRSSSKTTWSMQVTCGGAWPARMLGLRAIMDSTCCGCLHSIDCLIPLYLLYCICDNNRNRLFVWSCYIPRLSKDNSLCRVWIIFASSWTYSFSLIIFWLATEHCLVPCSIGRGIYAGLTSDTISFGVEILHKYLATITQRQMEEVWKWAVNLLTILTELARQQMYTFEAWTMSAVRLLVLSWCTTLK